MSMDCPPCNIRPLTPISDPARAAQLTSTCSTSLLQVAVGISRPRINQKTAKVLNSLDNEMKDRVLQQADTMLEYEDE